MKIIHVVEAFGGGVYSFLKGLCNDLSAKYEIIIVYSNRKETPINFKKDFNSNIKFIHIDMCRGFSIYNNIKSLAKLKKIIKNEKPDIVHLHSSKAGFIGRIACKQSLFPMNKVFYNPHGYSFLQSNESKLKRKLFFCLEKYASNLGGTVIGCSKGEAEEAKKLTNNVININNGIDVAEIDSIVEKFNYKLEDKIIIGTVGRITYQKNPKLFNEIAKSFPDYNFIWIGDGKLKNELSSSNIQVTGWLNRGQVLDKMAKLDIFIMTSLWEGLPISLLEAMYLKKVCLVSNVVGNKDVIIHEKCGYIANSIEDYNKFISYAVSNSSNVEYIKRNAREEVIKNYNTRKMANDYINLYESCYK